MMSEPMINHRYEQIMNLVMTTVLMTICICGLLGNTIVLVVGVVKRRYRNNVTSCYIMNLAVNDFLFLLTSAPLTAYLGVTKVWIYGEFICKMHIYLAHVFLQATCTTLAAMSIDRYLHVVHQVWYRSYRKPKYTRFICLFIWTISLVLIFPYASLFNTISNQHNQSSEQFNCNVNDVNSLLSSCIFTFGFYYALPLSIIFLCYLRVFLHVRRLGSRVVKLLSGLPRQSIQLKRRRVRRILLGLTLAFALCWLPIHVLELSKCSTLLSTSFYNKHFYTLTTARMFAHALSYFNSCLNPFLYALLNKGFFSKSS